MFLAALLSGVLSSLGAISLEGIIVCGLDGIIGCTLDGIIG